MKVRKYQVKKNDRGKFQIKNQGEMWFPTLVAYRDSVSNWHIPGINQMTKSNELNLKYQEPLGQMKWNCAGSAQGWIECRTELGEELTQFGFQLEQIQ
jgi:hypothetical protein